MSREQVSTSKCGPTSAYEWLLFGICSVIRQTAMTCEVEETDEYGRDDPNAQSV
jgi:hypothetical protein